MKVVFINRYFYPDHAATSQHLTDLAFFLSSLNWEVCVITSRQRYDNPTARLAHEEWINGVQVHRLWTSRFGRGGLLGRLSDYLTFYISVAWQLFRLPRRGDIVVAKIDPPLISVVAAVLARLRGARLINWLQDIFPDVALALGIVDLNGTLGKLLKKLRDFSLQAAVKNVVLGERMAAFVLSLGVSPEKISVIHNWTDDQKIRPLPSEKNSLRNAWGLNGKFVVGYSGNFGRVHEFEAILSAAEQLKDSKEITFLFIGDGQQRRQLEEEAERRGLSNIMFKPYQSRDRLGLSLTVPDVHLISLNPKLEGLIVPSKFYGAAAAGRPIAFIGDHAGELASIIRTADCGVIVSPREGCRLMGFLSGLAQNPNACKEMGQNARQALEQHFRKNSALNNWRDVLLIVSR